MAKGSAEVRFAKAAMEILNEIIAESAQTPRRGTSHTAGGWHEGRGTVEGALANENIETNISGEILQFSRALNFTLHIKKTAQGSEGKRKWKNEFCLKNFELTQ